MTDRQLHRLRRRVSTIVYEFSVETARADDQAIGT